MKKLRDQCMFSLRTVQNMELYRITADLKSWVFKILKLDILVNDRSVAHLSFC